MHAGVPIASLESLARLLQRRSAVTAGLDGRLFVAWVRTLNQGAAAAYGIDAPTWRFLSEGGEIAEDFADRCLAVLEGAAVSDVDNNSAESLPAAVVAELGRLLDTGSFDQVRVRPTAKASGEALYPRLRFRARDGVFVELPALEHISETDVTWRISAEGRTNFIEVPAPWPGDPVKPRSSSVGHPAKQVSVTVMPGNQTWNLELIDVEDPVVVFDAETGHLVPPRSDLPRGSVWVAFANQGGLPPGQVIEADDDIQVLGIADTPYGWRGWSFAEIATSSLSRLRYRGTERWRYVSTTVRPTVTEFSPIPFLTTASGQRVSSTRPKVVLPSAYNAASETTAAVSWVVTVASVSNPNKAWSQSFEAFTSSRTVDPWRDEEALLGEFTVTVRGPLGRGLSTRVAIAEGLQVSASTQFREMAQDGTGLVPATVRLRSLSEIMATTVPDITLSPSDRTIDAIVTAGGDTMAVTVTLPHMTVESHGPVSQSPSIRPLSINLEDLGSTELLVGCLPNREAELYLVSEGEIRQTVRGSAADSRGTRTFNLAQLSETATQAGSASLLLRAEGRSMPVAIVRPKRLALSVAIDEQRCLRVNGALAGADIACAIYPAFAPWLKPYVVPLEDGISAPLEDSVIREGTAKVMLRVEDPWAPEPWPRIVDPDNPNVFDVSFGPVVDVPAKSDSGFRSWLARTERCPSSVETLPLALKMYTLLREIRPAAPRRTLRREIAGAVFPNRESVVSAVLAIDAPAANLMRLFVEGGVVTVPGEAWASEPLLWTYSVALGILADSDQMQTEERDLFLNALATHAGSAAVSVVMEGRDDHASVGKFAPHLRAMHMWPQERVNEVWAAASPLPGRFLDKDPRASAAKELFDHRNDRELRPLIEQSRPLLTAIRQLLAGEVGSHALEPLTARTSEGGWMDLPALSLGLGLCARLAAMGSVEGNRLYLATRTEYADLAHAAPSIVERDLGLAELWLTKWRAQ